MANNIKLFEYNSFSASPNLRQRTTMLKTHVFQRKAFISNIKCSKCQEKICKVIKTHFQRVLNSFTSRSD